MVTLMRALAVGLLAAADVLVGAKLTVTAPIAPTPEIPFGFARALVEIA